MRTIVVISCIALLTGCQHADDLDNASEELPMSIEASIGEMQKSRYVSNDEPATPNNLSFEANDEIGLFVDTRSVVKWTNQGEDAWSAEESTVTWPNKKDEFNFYAYYPYVDAASKVSVPMPSLAGQLGTIRSLSGCDFLVASTRQNYGTDGIVSFTGDASFKHVSSLVAITIKGNCDLKASLIKKIYFAGENIASATTYSFASNSVTFTEDGESDKMESGDLNFQMIEEDKTFYFILNRSIALSDITFGIEYATEDVNYKAEKAGLGSETLTGGVRYSFNLSISDGVLTVSGGEIQDWEDGTPMDDIVINSPTIIEEESNDENV